MVSGVGVALSCPSSFEAESGHGSRRVRRRKVYLLGYRPCNRQGVTVQTWLAGRGGSQSCQGESLQEGWRSDFGPEVPSGRPRQQDENLLSESESEWWE